MKPWELSVIEATAFLRMTTARTIWSLLEPAQRRSAIMLFVLMVYAMLLEMAGIGMVVPALAFIVDDAAITEAPVVKSWITWLGSPSQPQLIVAGLAVLFAVYVVKAGFLLFVAFCQSHFVANVQSEMTRRLFAKYVMQPWAFHLNHNSADLIRNIESVQGFAVSCTALISLATEFLVLAGVVGLLLWYEPVGAAVVAVVLGGATYLYDVITRHRLASWGQRRHRHHAAYMKHMQEGLGGAKDIKIVGGERQLIQRFAADSRGMARMSGRQSWFQQIPRMWCELLAAAALCLLTGVMIWQGKPLQSFVPSLGLFATAAFRMLPSVNRLAVALHQIRWASEITESLKAELALPDYSPAEERGRTLPFAAALRLENVCYRYPGSDRDTLSGVSLTIPHGAAVGLVGGSGAGKSTLVDIMLGLLSPTEGRVLVDGVNIKDHVRAWQNLVGYVPQSIYLCDDTLRRNVAFGLADDAIDENALRRAMQAAQLEELVASLPEGLDTIVGERGVRLSGGQRQRVGIARALYHDPAVLVLDEATSALDDATERDVMTAVNSLHGAKTLIIVAHRMTTVRECDVLFRIENGRLVRTGALGDVV